MTLVDRSLHKQADVPKSGSFAMAEVNGNNKRPPPQEHAKKKPPPGFYVDFPDILRIEEKDLMQPDPPLSFKDWPRRMQLGLIAGLLPLMRSELDPEARRLIVQYREVRELDMNSIWDSVDGPDIRKAQLENNPQSMNLQRISRAIRSWQTLHAKVAGKIGGRDVGRLLAKFLLDCLVFCRLKWPEAGGFPQIPLLSQLIRDTMSYLKETAWTETDVSNPLGAPISTTDSSFFARPTAGTLKDPIATNTVNIPTPQTTDDGARYSGEESHGDFVSLVKACVVSQPEGAKLLDHMVSNLHVKRAAYKLLKLPKLLSRSKFKWQRTGVAGILLHGPPGTGKTSFAEAMAFEARHTLIKVPASSIRSRFVGNSEKIMRAVFEVAEAMSPSIVFIDEFDHLGSNREAVGGEKSKELKSEFLAAWSECNARGADITVLGATNLPWILDEAIISRFTQVLHVPLPNHDDRAVMLQGLLSDHWHHIGGKDWECLSKSLEGRSGRDIVNIVDQVAMNIGEEMFKAQLFERQYIATLNEHLWVPCDLAKKGNTVQKPYTSLDPSEAHPRQITMSDVMSVLETMGRVSVSSNQIKHHEAFALRYGKGN